MGKWNGLITSLYHSTFEPLRSISTWCEQCLSNNKQLFSQTKLTVLLQILHNMGGIIQWLDCVIIFLVIRQIFQIIYRWIDTNHTKTYNIFWCYSWLFDKKLHFIIKFLSHFYAKNQYIEMRYYWKSCTVNCLRIIPFPMSIDWTDSISWHAIVDLDFWWNIQVLNSKSH